MAQPEATLDLNLLLTLLRGASKKKQGGGEAKDDDEDTTRRKIESTATYAAAMSRMNMALHNPIRNLIVPELLEFHKITIGEETRVELFPALDGPTLAKSVRSAIHKHEDADIDLIERFGFIVQHFAAEKSFDFRSAVNVLGDLKAIHREAQSMLFSGRFDDNANDLVSRLRSLVSITSAIVTTVEDQFKTAALKQLDDKKKKPEPTSSVSAATSATPH
jgi:hypothetical protein